MRCAKLRSMTLDKVNLIDYMLDATHSKEFEPVPNGPDLSALAAGLAQDLDVIAAAASFALKNPKDAMEPEPYARTRMAGNADYKITTLPANLPNHKGALIFVPDFSVCKSSGAVQKLADDNDLTLNLVKTALPRPPGSTFDTYIFAFKQQDPPASSPAALGSTVTIVFDEYSHVATAVTETIKTRDLRTVVRP
jgi:hypothetical protein